MANTNQDLVRDAVVSNQDGMIEEISDLLDSKDARIAKLELSLGSALIDLESTRTRLKVTEMALARASEGLPV